MIWTVTYSHCYLYGCSVIVFTDHSAVKVVLETPSPTGKLPLDGLSLLSLPRQSRQGRNSNSHSVEKASLHICQITKPHQLCWVTASISQSSRDEQPRELCRVCSECGWGTGYRCGHHGPSCDQSRKHVQVFQDYLTKWPMVYAIPDQKSHRIVKILVEEIVMVFGVPEALLSD